MSTWFELQGKLRRTDFQLGAIVGLAGAAKTLVGTANRAGEKTRAWGSPGPKWSCRATV